MKKTYVLSASADSGAFRIDYSKELNAAQLEVVTKGEGPTLVLAGAGSGKTRTLVYRVAYLLEKGIAPDRILLVTFTNKAADEMRRRVEHLLETKAKGLWCGTFHHVANRILRQYGKPLGLQSDFGILDEEDSRDLVKACLKSLEHEFGGVKLPKPGVLQNAISFSVNAQTDLSVSLPRQAPYLMPLLPAIQKLKSRYEERKLRTRNLDYDDLLVWTLRLLKEDPATREALASRFQYCLVDEYQDTNRLQHEIVKLLSATHRNLLVVGDDAQSIYSFRAATIRNILDFPKEFPDCRTFRLETNYRSVPSILALANHSIRMNREQFPKTLVSLREPGERPQWIKLKDARQEASFVGQKILELRSAGMPLSEMAVLFRAHFQAAELELELARRGIDYVVRGGVRFFEQAHIKDVLAYLRILSNPADELAWIRALTLYPGIGAGYADRIYESFTSLPQGLEAVCQGSFAASLPMRVRQGFGQFQSVLKRILEPEKRDRPEIIIEQVLEQGYSKHLLMNFENARDRIEDIRQLINFAHSYKTLKSFLADTMLKEGFRGETFAEEAAPDPAEKPLVLSTIHQAKGLEWKAVFVIGLSEGQFPHARSMASDTELEEERRLFYVSCTRAKDLLFLSQPLMRYDYQAGMVINRPSPFLLELGSDLYDEVEVEEERATDTIYIDEDPDL